LFRLIDLVIDQDAAGVLTFVEELADQGQDMTRLVTDLLEHLRHLLLVQHMGEVPDSIPVTDETRDRLRAQSNQLPPGEVIRLIDLLAFAVEEIREGGDPRLPLELALVKVSRPQADSSREALVQRVEQLEARTGREPRVAAAPEPSVPPAAGSDPIEAPSEQPSELDLEQLQHAWRQAVIPALEERSIPAASMLREARPVELAGARVVIEFPPSASFHRNLAEEPKNVHLLTDVLHEVTGRKLTPAFSVAEGADDSEEPGTEEPTTEEDIVTLLKQTFDAREDADE
jgi:DNA polymerase-3 subunit gamma/tau